MPLHSWACLIPANSMHSPPILTPPCCGPSPSFVVQIRAANVAKGTDKIKTRMRFGNGNAWPLPNLSLYLHQSKNDLVLPSHLDFQRLRKSYVCACACATRVCASAICPLPRIPTDVLFRRSRLGRHLRLRLAPPPPPSSSSASFH